MKKWSTTSICSISFNTSYWREKLSVYQMISIIKGRVLLIMKNTLSLLSDQISKLSNLQNYNITSFQLDSIKTSESPNKVISFLTEIDFSKIDYSIFVFISPKALLLRCWNNAITHLIQNNILSQICVNEVHLFVKYTISFWANFLKFKQSLFNRVNHYLFE